MLFEVEKTMPSCNHHHHNRHHDDCRRVLGIRREKREHDESREIDPHIDVKNGTGPPRRRKTPATVDVALFGKHIF